MPVELVTHIAEHLVSDPSKLRVEAKRDGQSTIIEIHCAPGDAGRVIGRGGRVINSIRTLARAAAEGQGRVDINIVDENSADRNPMAENHADETPTDETPADEPQ